MWRAADRRLIEAIIPSKLFDGEGLAVRPSPAMWLLLLAVAQSGVKLFALKVVRDLLRRCLLLVRVLLTDLLAVIVGAAHGQSPCLSHAFLRFQWSQTLGFITYFHI